MAKKEPTIQDAVESFKAVIARVKATGFERNNRVLFVHSDKCNNMILVPDVELWTALSEDPDIKDITVELNPAIDHDRLRMEMMSFGEKMDEEWIDIKDEDMTNDHMLAIKVEGFDYDIEINNNIFPLRFKKAEAGGIAYRIFNQPFHSFVIRKKMETPVEGGSFYIARVFRII